MNSLLANIYSIGGLAQSFYLADFFDVAIVALLIYSAILLFKQTRSVPALIGIGMLIAVYITAQVFNLYLTSIALQSFFGVFIVVLVVIFQEELRRFFEFIATWSTRQNKLQPIIVGSSAMNEMIQAIAHLAHEKTGALIVLTGKENIERHTEGGKTLDGIISEELLLSIFDPTSPGHDGAMIINKNRIIQFGAHLPLSNNFGEIGKHGTRHSAALGLVERTDAFAIVVSEEQGTISVAYNGSLKQMKNIGELEKMLNKFLEEKFPEASYSLAENVLRKNSLEKIIAFFVAVFLWFIIAFPAETTQRDFVVPISYRNVPENFIIESVLPENIAVTLVGRGPNAFDRIEEKGLEASIDGNLLTPGVNKILIDESMVSRPINLSVVTINPGEVQISAMKYNKSDAPIEIRVHGNVARGYVIDSAVSIPRSITLLVPDGANPPAAIDTESIDVSGLQRQTSFTAKLLLPPGARLKQETDAIVNVVINVKKK